MNNWGDKVSKKNKTTKKSNKELLQEIRGEGMFKEASDFTNKKKKYVAASNKDQFMMYVLLIVALLAFVFINRLFGV